ncbi:MAG: hypothetical protein KJP07_15360 [Desulfatitalea sp.]|nr:hypothetical protein [Desulfatitalea sp.]
MRWIIADESHDNEICRLMSSVSMSGNVELIYARWPSFFHGLGVQGKFNEIGLVEKEGIYVGMGVRSIKPMYINGGKVEFGYLHSLRAARGREGGITKKIFEALREQHGDKKTWGYVNTIIENNFNAMRSLLSGKEGMPTYVDYGRYLTYAVNMNKRKRPLEFSCDTEVKKGDEIELESIVNFLNKEGCKKQFYPVYTVNDFHTEYVRDFHPKNFYVAFQADTIVGVAAKWDQSRYKQYVVMGYHGLIKYFRCLVNAGIKLSGYRPLPGKMEKLNMFYVSFVSIKENDPSVLLKLIDRIYQDNKDEKYHFFMMGFHETDALKKAMDKYYTICYPSRLYLVLWKEDYRKSEEINKKMIPYLELATL